MTTPFVRHVTPHNCGQPLRGQHSDPIHPHLSEVSGYNHIAPGIGKSSISSSSEAASVTDANTTPPHPNTSSVSNIASESAASPAAGGASERCICLEYIGDNGPCPVHGTRGGAK